MLRVTEDLILGFICVCLFVGACLNPLFLHILLGKRL